MVLTEVTLATVLLIGAALMLQSFRRLLAVDPGFTSARVAAFSVSLFGERYNNGAKQRQFYRETRDRLVAVPGMQAAGAISSLPLGGSQDAQWFFIEGIPPRPAGQAPMAETRKITPGYFDTMGIPVQRGRGVADQDLADQPKVCVVNETLARQFFGGDDPIGRRLKLLNDAASTPSWTIVGVVRDVKGYALDTAARPQIYLPVEQQTQNEMTIVVRSHLGDSARLEKSLREAMKIIDPALPLARFRTMDSLVNAAVARPRFTAWLIGLFALTALLLTVVGLYGVANYAAAQRTREIGLRLALGASRGQVLALVIREGMTPALVGLVLGLAGSMALAGVLATQLYEISPTDPLTLASVFGLLGATVLVACWLPARRAAKVDPMVALRAE
jgi:putative ABC transport system permease protein